MNLFPGNGYIEGSELDGFLKEFVSSVNANDSGSEVSRQAGEGGRVWEAFPGKAEWLLLSDKPR